MVTAGNAETMAFRITPDKAETVWTARNTGDPRDSSPVVFQDHVYITAACYSDTPLRCLALQTGEVKWEAKDDFSMCKTASAILADGKIIANVEDSQGAGFTLMFKATPEKFEELGRFRSNAASRTSPALAGDRLFLRLENGLACYDLANP